MKWLLGIALFGTTLIAGEHAVTPTSRTERPKAPVQVTPQALADIDADLDLLGRTIGDYGKLVSSDSRVVRAERESIIARIESARGKITGMLDCRKLEKFNGSPDALKRADRFNTLLGEASRQSAHTKHLGTKFFGAGYPLFTNDHEALRRGVIYPGTGLEALSPGARGAHARLDRHLGSEVAVYNPTSCGVETRYAYTQGVAGVYNPRTGSIEWKTEYRGGVAGAYNPVTGQVEWKTAYRTGVSAVFNPAKGIVEFKTAFRSGVAGYYDPGTQSVIFKARFRGGIGWNPAAGQFEDRHRGTVSFLSVDPKNPTLSAAAYQGVTDSDD